MEGGQANGSKPLIALVLFGIIATVTLVLASTVIWSPWSSSVDETQFHRSGTMVGWYSINFPICSRVSVAWRDWDGGKVGFVVTQTAARELAESCYDHILNASPPAANGCPQSVCFPVSWGPVALLFQVGNSGSFPFIASQRYYCLVAWSAPSFAATSNDTIGIEISYST
jgi:hypothetical protein